MFIGKREHHAFINIYPKEILKKPVHGSLLHNKYFNYSLFAKWSYKIIEIDINIPIPFTNKAIQFYLMLHKRKPDY